MKKDDFKPEMMIKVIKFSFCFLNFRSNTVFQEAEKGAFVNEEGWFNEAYKYQ